MRCNSIVSLKKSCLSNLFLETTVGDVYHLLARLISNSVLEMTLKKDSEQDETADSSGMMTPTETEQSGRITQADICENCEENNQVVKNGMCQ